MQPSQQNCTVKLYNKNKRRKDQASPPSEDYLQVAIQQIQLTPPSSTEELVHPVQQQATIQVQQQPSLLSPTVQPTPVSTTPVTKHDCALQEFINGEDCCQKFIMQDLTFFQPSQIQRSLKFTDQSTSLHKDTVDKKKLIRLPEKVEEGNYSSTHVQTVEPTLGITPEQLHHICENPAIVPADILETKPVKNYTETNIKTLDGIVVQQPKRFLPLTQEAK